MTVGELRIVTEIGKYKLWLHAYFVLFLIVAIQM